MKILKTILISSTFIFVLLLWLTRLEWLPSMSAFALSDNVIWYYLMHFSIIGIFIWDYITHKNWESIIVSLFGVGVLIFDMYSFPIMHNIMTALLFASGVYNIIRYADNTQERVYSIFNASVGTLFFLVGLWSNMHLFFAEGVAEFCLAVSMTRRVWLYE